MYKAKLCPKCKDKMRRLVIDDNDNRGGKRYAVQCHGCGISGPVAHNEAEAVSLWNEFVGVEVSDNGR